MSQCNDCQCDHFEMHDDNHDSFSMWQGLVGPYYLPSVDENGNISWTNNGGLPNPATQNIQGPPGQGVQISGRATSTAGLPPTAEQGTMYAVGAEEPYDAYCYLGTWVPMGKIFPPGPQGATGLTPNIQIGTVQTGAAGSQAEATITGTTDNPLLNLVIPKGDKGDKGDAATTVANILDEETGKTYQVSQSVNAAGYLIEEFTEVTS